jgi:hypothetical protein
MLNEVIPKQYNHQVALHGLGGVGKTQTAMAYANEISALYKSIYWVDAATEESLLRGFRMIAIRSCSNNSSVMLHNVKFLAESVYAWLQHQDHWLFVFDSLDQVGLVEDMLPVPAPNKHTLITTRYRRNPHSRSRGATFGSRREPRVVIHTLRSLLELCER